MYRKVTEHFCLLLKVKNPPSFVGLPVPRETVGQQNLSPKGFYRSFVGCKAPEDAARSHSGLKVKSSNFAKVDCDAVTNMKQTSED